MAGGLAGSSVVCAWQTDLVRNRAESTPDRGVSDRNECRLLPAGGVESGITENDSTGGKDVLQQV